MSRLRLTPPALCLVTVPPIALGLLFTVPSRGSAADFGLGTQPAWSALGGQLNARFGGSVAPAGDVNGDGYGDIIVGAYNFSGGQSGEGRAFLYLGSAAGVDPMPAWTVESDQTGADFGWAVATAGDVNGDGYSDVIVGARRFENGQTDEGRAFVYHGSPGGLSLTPDWTAESNQVSAQFGYSVASVGDVNGDGFSDVVVGAPYFDNGQVDEGWVYIYHGSTIGLSAQPDRIVEINQASAEFGISVGLAGDVNGDGFSDLIVGARLFDDTQTNEGAAFIYHGSAAGLAAAPAWSEASGQANARFGHAVATAGDVNGDGFSDVVVGAYLFDNGQGNEGGAFVYHGSAAGMGPAPAWAAESNQSNAEFGVSVATAGDVDGDGYADVVVGVHTYDNGLLDEGRAFVYRGSPGGLSAVADWTGEPDAFEAYFGESVATAGDVNGDGLSDVIVGAVFHEGVELAEGAAFVYHGAVGGPGSVPGWSADGEYFRGAFGYSVDSAGDVNGDGFEDIIVGIPAHGATDGRVLVHHGAAGGPGAVPDWQADGFGYLGYSVAGAGDVNGDGYGDVVVGEPTYAGRGRAQLFHGAAAGLSPTADWVVLADSAGAFGAAVASAGDVNGDGYGDVIVAQPFVDLGSLTDVGQVFVYHGSATGLSLVPDWTTVGGGAFASYGYAVASAGDVNGDGYSDVVVGAPRANVIGLGEVFVFYGSAGGLSPAPSWTTDGGIDHDSQFGSSVAGAGDIDGDGYGDVIVGAHGFGDPEFLRGRALLFRGSSGGLEPTPAWTVDGGSAGDHFGYTVDSAGDVDGDGFSDVVVAAAGYRDNSTMGRSFLYLGGTGGLAQEAAWNAPARQEPDFAVRLVVAGAGDVNGDGFGDVLIGDPYFDLNFDEGTAVLHFGNGGQGRLTLPRQHRTDGATMIAPLGRSDSETQFRIRAVMLSFYGRTRLQMEHEVKPLGSSFDGLNTSPGGFFDIGDDGVINFNRLVSGLEAGQLYHWRVRPKYDLAKTPFQRNGPWVHLPARGWNESDLRMAGGDPVGIAEDPRLSQGPDPLLLAIGPNPGPGYAEILFTLVRPERVAVDVLDVTGRRVAVLTESEHLPAGTHRLRWNGRDVSGARVAAGVYVVRVIAGDETGVGKVVLTR